MTDIEKKALALVTQLQEEDDGKKYSYAYYFEALCRAIEQHEAFKREVSDAVEAVFAGYHDAPIPWVVMRRKLEPFIIAKPDPLVEALKQLKMSYVDAEDFRAALAARGLEIREKQ